MYEFLSQNALYIVLLIVLIGWVGIFSYLLRLDKKMTKLEKMFKE
ncbi:MAG: CcmD family protein [Ignavibacteriales bacterium]|nr:CcmD family protein [Ignavibacteriales bacterium]